MEIRYCTCGHTEADHGDDVYTQGCQNVTRRRRCRCKAFTLADRPPAKVAKVDASHIIGLLRQRHEGDVFVEECKNGPTHNPIDRLLKLDAWAMPKSWAHWCAVGYEVKVSRHDFEQDQKWVDYLPYCTHFYFVCPGGLIRSTDLPDNIGLLWVSQNGEKLHTKRHARTLEVDAKKLVNLMSYVLMARAVIVGDMHQANRTEAPAEQTRLQRLAKERLAVEVADASKQLAWLVQGHIRKRVDEAQEKLTRAETLMKWVEKFKAHLASLGIDWDIEDRQRLGENFRVEREIDKLTGRLDPWTLNHLEAGAKDMLQAVETIRKLRAESAKLAGSSDEED